jgi:hypothetical protein
MFIPPLLADLILAAWIVGGALLGASFGWYSADLLNLDRRRAWIDALTGVLAVVALALLLVAVSSLGTVVQVDGVTLGWRRVLLDYPFAWGFGMIVVAVVGRQLLVLRNRRRRGDDPSPAGVSPT